MSALIHISSLWRMQWLEESAKPVIIKKAHIQLASYVTDILESEDLLSIKKGSQTTFPFKDALSKKANTFVYIGKKKKIGKRQKI